MNLYIRTEKYPHNWPAASDELLAMLGLKDPPPEGLGIKVVQGIKVWIDPLRGDKPARGKRQGIRVMAMCPRCSKVMAASRLPQHATVHKDAA